MKKALNIVIRKASEDDVDNWASILHESLNLTYSNYISHDYLDNNYTIQKLKQSFFDEINRGGQSFIYWQLMRILLVY